jgi:hypothetical protein
MQAVRPLILTLSALCYTEHSMRGQVLAQQQVTFTSVELVNFKAFGRFSVALQSMNIIGGSEQLWQVDIARRLPRPRDYAPCGP